MSNFERDKQQLAELLLIGTEGEPLKISSELQSRLTDLGDTEMRFTVSNPEGRSRYGVVITWAELRVEE